MNVNLENQFNTTFSVIFEIKMLCRDEFLNTSYNDLILMTFDQNFSINKYLIFSMSYSPHVEVRMAVDDKKLFVLRSSAS